MGRFHVGTLIGGLHNPPIVGLSLQEPFLRLLSEYPPVNYSPGTVLDSLVRDACGFQSNVSKEPTHMSLSALARPSRPQQSVPTSLGRLVSLPVL